MTLFSIVLLLGTIGVAEAKSKGDIPEFQLPSFDVDAVGVDVTPIPKKTDPPRVHSGLNGTEVTMTFYISESGKVTILDDDASPYNNEEFELACLMRRQLTSWRFEPAHDDEGNAISVKVRLPVKVVENGDLPKSELASLSLKRPVIVAVAKK